MTTTWLVIAWLVGCSGTTDDGTTSPTDDTPTDTPTSTGETGGTDETDDTGATGTTPTGETGGGGHTGLDGTSVCGPAYGGPAKYAVGGGIGTSSLYRIHLGGEIDEWVADFKYQGRDVVIQDLIVEGSNLAAISGGSALTGAISDGVIELHPPLPLDPEPPTFVAAAGGRTAYYGIENNGRGIWYVNEGTGTTAHIGNVPLPPDCSGAFDFLQTPGAYPTTQFTLGLNCSYAPVNRQYLVDLAASPPTATYLGEMDGDDWLVAVTEDGEAMEEHELWILGQSRNMAYCVTSTFSAPIAIRGVAR